MDACDAGSEDRALKHGRAHTPPIIGNNNPDAAAHETRAYFDPAGGCECRARIHDKLKDGGVKTGLIHPDGETGFPQIQIESDLPCKDGPDHSFKIPDTPIKVDNLHLTGCVLSEQLACHLSSAQRRALQSIKQECSLGIRWPLGQQVPGRSDNTEQISQVMYDLAM